MQNMLKFGLKTLFLLVVLLGVGAIYSIDQSQTYGRLINYVGIVRGATQRRVKLELAQEPHDDLIAYLDGIQDELRTGEGPYGLIRPDDLEYNNNLSQLQRLWGTLKEDILAARQDKTASAALLRASEDYFDLANKTVFAAESFAHKETSMLLRLIVLMAAFLLLTWLVIRWAYGKKCSCWRI